MTTVTDDPDEFRDKWESYIDGLDRLKSSLPQDRWDELDEIKADLEELVEAAIIRE